jgi:nucleolar protein 53
MTNYFRLPEAPLEVLLLEDLPDSLRRLKPEGNLLTDRYRSLLLQGKIESRRVAQSKKKQPKLTEKWSYKDWKLQA